MNNKHKSGITKSDAFEVGTPVIILQSGDYFLKDGTVQDQIRGFRETDELGVFSQHTELYPESLLWTGLLGSEQDNTQIVTIVYPAETFENGITMPGDKKHLRFSEYMYRVKVDQRTQILIRHSNLQSNRSTHVH